VSHVDEQLFGEVSELLCAAAGHLPQRFSKAKRTAAAAAASVRSRMPATMARQRPEGHALPPSAHPATTPTASADLMRLVDEGTSQSQLAGGLHKGQPLVLHAGTVSRAMWAFAMMGLHDDPVLPALMPHVRVGG